MKQSNWKGFIRDFGDAFGGFGIGYAVATKAIAFGIIGLFLIILSIYLRFYIDNTKTN